MLSKAQFGKAFQHFPYFKLRNLALMKPSLILLGGMPLRNLWCTLKQPWQPLPSAVLYHLLQVSFTQNRKLRIKEFVFSQVIHNNMTKLLLNLGFSDFESSSFPTHIKLSLTTFGNWVVKLLQLYKNILFNILIAARHFHHL